MHKWFVRDRDGREIYLSEERWEHIVSRPSELSDHLEEVLNAVRQGRRRQQPHDPQTYAYRTRCNSLRSPFNGILVVVTFRFESDAISGNKGAKNFVVSAWGLVLRN